ncbi:prolyl oligopeptidase family serine peptidase [Jatrophihabitans fulvus]
MPGFANFDDYLAHDRVTDLALSPDGTRLVATVQTLNADGDAFVSSLWELDPSGRSDARRLTRSKEGESGPVFAADGSLLFTSARPAPKAPTSGDDDAAAPDDDVPALWRLPAVGEAERVLTRPGGIAGVRAARHGDRVVLGSDTLPGATDAKDEAARRKARKDLKTTAILHTASPVRFWDHDLGPDETRLLSWDGAGEPVDLTPEPGRALDEASYVISPDGTTVVSSWARPTTPGFPHAALVAIDTATGERRTLAQDDSATFEAADVSPDGRWALAVRHGDCTPDEPWTTSLRLVELATGEGRELVGDPDVQPSSARFGADAGTVYFTADEQGHAPVFRLDVASDTWTRVTASGHYTSLRVAADGTTLYALRDAWDSPPRPVRLDGSATDGEPAHLPAPGEASVPGTLERLSAIAPDGTEIGAWLVLPENASADTPVPLLLFIHGGPFASWNGWTWRWNPWLMAAKGYAVLLPDPALSTGYGVHMRKRAWGRWGEVPFGDLMAVTDAVVARPDIDGSRTAAMGGSYGGYMANWVAGHTDRFRCIVTHASLWALDQFQGTTDVPGDWALEWGLPDTDPERYALDSPHLHADEIRTPMLVVHGDKDYRVPVGEGLRLWWDLQRRGVESKFLYFADEGHWILKPGNARLWYETVWAWLAQHVLGEQWQQPAAL